MKTGCVLVLLWILPWVALGQDSSISVEDLLSAGEEFIQENVDPDAFEALTGMQQQQVRSFFQDLQKKLGGEYVVELASLKEAAQAILPLLDSYVETEGYAAWIKTRLDYFEAADRLRRQATNITPGIPIPNPRMEVQRSVWVETYRERPVPKAAAPYLPRLKPIFAAEKVPVQLVWLAEVESGFNPRALSPVGAAGLYQLMPVAARQSGLSLSPRDERLVPESNARAAARYLRYLYPKFRDWPLTLAAYNAGEGKVQRLLERHRTRSFERIAAYLPAETQLYVPKMEAVLLRREGIKLASLPAPGT